VSTFTFDDANHCVDNNNVVFNNTSSSYYPATFKWTFGDESTASEISPQHKYKAAGEYVTTLTAKTDYCSASFAGAHKIIIYNNPAIEISGDQNICVGSAANLSIVNKGNDVLTDYAWYINGVASDENTANLRYKFDQSGSYKIRASTKSQQGCGAIAEEINVNVKSYPVLDLTNAYNVRSGDNIVIQSSTADDNFRYNWYPQTGLSCYDCANPVFNSTASTQYHLSVSTSEGCVAEKNITVTVIKNNDEPVNGPCPGITMPNAFTPNGDGQNDVFYIKGCLVSFVKNFSIYDKFGRRIFIRENFPPNDKSFGWDGKVNGVNTAQTDTFVFVAEIVDSQGKSQLLKGTVLLLR